MEIQVAINGSVNHTRYHDFPGYSLEPYISAAIGGGGNTSTDLRHNNSLGTVAPSEDPRVVLALQQLAVMRILVQKILMPLVVLFGVIGNMLNIAVLTRRWMRSSTNCYLTALAVSDTMYLILSFMMSLYHHGGVFQSSGYWIFMMLVARPFLNVSSATGVWMTATFTLERYIGVRYPMKGKVLCTPRRARFIIAVVIVFVVILTLPDFFTMKLTYKTEGNRTIAVPEPTSLGKRPSYTIGYNLTNQAFFTFIPLTLLITFNSLLIKTVWKAMKQRKAMTKMVVVQNDRTEKHHREQHRITTMLIVVVLVFLVCQTPQGIANLYFFLNETWGKMTKLMIVRRTILGNVCNLLVAINCSCNFILYSSFSVKFRRTFRKLFCRCLPRRFRQDFIFSDVLSHYSQHGAQPAAATHTTRIPSSPRITPRNSLVPDMNINPPKKHRNGYLAVPSSETSYPKGVNLFISKL